ncbi:hypothetical protein LX36DRAFT_658468, partial [Colletotrichum falcatum]
MSLQDYDMGVQQTANREQGDWGRPVRPFRVNQVCLTSRLCCVGVGQASVSTFETDGAKLKTGPDKVESCEGGGEDGGIRARQRDWRRLGNGARLGSVVNVVLASFGSCSQVYFEGVPVRCRLSLKLASLWRGRGRALETAVVSVHPSVSVTDMVGRCRFASMVGNVGRAIRDMS